jgi:hypothetical protein
MADTPTMERDWPTEIREWADMELPATEAFMLEVAAAFEKFAGLHAASRRLVATLGEIEGKARWYADNDGRDPQEVDHALCVEILDLAQRALDAAPTSSEFGRMWAKDDAYYAAAEALGIKEPPDACVEAGRHVCGPDDGALVLGLCPHGVDLDRDICPEGCRV